MKVAILSDVHDQVWKLETALSFMTEEADFLIFCGDFCSPFVLAQIAEDFDGIIHVVFGNNDGDQYRMTKLASRWKHVYLHGEAWFGEIGGDSFAVSHFPEIARAFAKTGTYDVVCYGHNHQQKVESIGHTLLINPGCLMGYAPASKTDVAATFAVYDTDSGAVVIYEVQESEVTLLE